MVLLGWAKAKGKFLSLFKSVYTRVSIIKSYKNYGPNGVKGIFQFKLTYTSSFKLTQETNILLVRAIKACHQINDFRVY